MYSGTQKSSPKAPRGNAADAWLGGGFAQPFGTSKEEAGAGTTRVPVPSGFSLPEKSRLPEAPGFGPVLGCTYDVRSKHW